MGNSPLSRWLAAAALLACTVTAPAAAQDAPDPAALPPAAVRPRNIGSADADVSTRSE